MRKEMTCIVCPQGCRLLVDIDDKTKDIQVSNHKCKRGPIYAQKELTNPTRFLTATIAIENATHHRLPIKSSMEVPKQEMFNIMRELNHVIVKAPVECGDIVVKNILGLNIDIIATRDMNVKDI